MAYTLVSRWHRLYRIHIARLWFEQKHTSHKWYVRWHTEGRHHYAEHHKRKVIYSRYAYAGLTPYIQLKGWYMHMTNRAMLVLAALTLVVAAVPILAAFLGEPMTEGQMMSYWTVIVGAGTLGMVAHETMARQEIDDD